jgi:apolipoprotein D and lipocalin family protein
LKLPGERMHRPWPDLNNATQKIAAQNRRCAMKAETGMRKLSTVLVLLLTGCMGIPENVGPVDGFRLEKYLGQWYEIARLDHSFERGLSRVTANYSLREDGGVRVLNRGYSEKEKSWKEAEGKAYFVQRADQGYLKVSFFGPFYGSYVVFELDQENYQYALVSGPDQSYLWILARSPDMNKELRDRLVAAAAKRGFDTSKLIFVDHRWCGAAADFARRVLRGISTTVLAWTLMTAMARLAAVVMTPVLPRLHGSQWNL